MTKELFEKAKFGDRFVTKDGKEALFLRLTENSEWQFANFYVKDWGEVRVNRENGKWLNGPDTENDIVGKISSPPSNLDEAAIEIVNNAIDTNDTTIVKYEGLLRYLVKAGAEWMAGQGWHDVTETPSIFGLYLVIHKKGWCVANYMGKGVVNESGWVEVIHHVSVDAPQKWFDLRDLIPKKQ